jgi:ribonuclease HII
MARVAANLGGLNFALEHGMIADGVWPIAGVDEAGRGPLAGPVAIAAVILDPDDPPEGVADSKMLTAARREELYEIIIAKALAVSLAFIDAKRIDAINIRAATLHGMGRAVRALALAPTLALIDGRDLPDGLPCPGRPMVRGDATCASIAAASIIAKVSRDRLMTGLDLHLPGYGFASHVGYATKRHFEALDRLGPTRIHRRSFLGARI